MAAAQVTEPHVSEPAPVGRPAIELVGIDKSFGSVHAVRAVSLAIGALRGWAFAGTPLTKKRSP